MGRVSIFREYTLEISHRLNCGVPDGHKCKRLHGHRYELKLEVGGELDENGMLVEYDDLDRVVWPVLRHMDHHHVNETNLRCSTDEAAALAHNPTIERVAHWLGARLAGVVASAVSGRRLVLAKVEVREDPQSGAVWTP